MNNGWLIKFKLHGIYRIDISKEKYLMYCF